MFDHPEADDLVVSIRCREVAVVLEAHVDPVAETCLPDPLFAAPRLLGADGDPGRPRPVLDGGVQEDSPPPAADVEQVLSGPQSELDAGPLDLAPLGGVEVLIEVGVAGRRVHPGGAGDPAEHLVGEVVVIGDGLGVALLVVDAGAFGGTEGRVEGVPVRTVAVPAGEGRAGLGARGDRLAVALAGEITPQVGFAEPHEVRLLQQGEDRGGTVQDRRERWFLA